MKIIVTGGAGFIGSALVRMIVNENNYKVLNVDKLTYAGHLKSLEGVSNSDRYQFEQVDICDAEEINRIFNEFQPDAIMHLAAESHVDRSIDGSAEFIKTNINGTHILLEEAKQYWQGLDDELKENFRFLHVSTDEVYGELGETGFFTEETPYDPRSPYSSSKASSDHLVRAWYHTYGLPTMITNCSNNYGPYHHPEKLIPSIILKAIHGERLTIYGNGRQIRDWLYVDDHVDALLLVARLGKNGEQYNIGGNNELMNKDVVVQICDLLEERVLVKPGGVDNFKDLISHIGDRAGHDKRYAVDTRKIYLELGWVPKQNFRSGLQKTVDWFLSNEDWWREVYAREHKNCN